MGEGPGAVNLYERLAARAATPATRRQYAAIYRSFADWLRGDLGRPPVTGDVVGNAIAAYVRHLETSCGRGGRVRRRVARGELPDQHREVVGPPGVGSPQTSSSRKSRVSSWIRQGREGRSVFGSVIASSPSVQFCMDEGWISHATVSTPSRTQDAVERGDGATEPHAAQQLDRGRAAGACRGQSGRRPDRAVGPGALADANNELLRIDLAIRDWSRRDPAVAERLRRVDNRRMEYLRSLFGGLGLDGDEVEVRSLLAFSLWIADHFIAADHGRRTREEVLDLAMKRLARR